jgi:hypothetical protein
MFLMLTTVFLAAYQVAPAVTNAGTAISLRGTSYIRTTLWSPDLFTSEDFTFELWFKANAPGVLVGEVDTADVSLWDFTFIEVLADGRVRAGVPGVPSFSVGEIPFGTWHHVALTYDHAVKVLTGYLDGIPTGSSPGERTHPSEAGRTAVYAFGRGGPTNLGSGNWFSGELDEIRIWDRSRPPEFISMFFNQPLQTTEPGLVGYWQFDSASGNLLPDSSLKRNPALYVPGSGTPALVPSSVPLTVHPVVRTLSSVAEGGIMRLNGMVEPHGYDLSVFFEWGSTPDLENKTVIQRVSSSVASQTVSVALTNVPAGNYFFRIVGLLTNETILGNVEMFGVFGVPGGAISLKGDDYFRTTLWSHQMFQNENFTFELWFNATEPGVLINEADTADVTRWDMSFAEIFSNGILKAGVPGVPIITIAEVPLNQWHHLALSYDQTNRILALYLNGHLTGSASGDRLSPADVGRTAVYAFGRGGATNLTGGKWFRGEMDEVRIWNSALSSEAVTASYKKIIETGATDLQAYWKFDSVNNDLIPDYSARGNSALYVSSSRSITLVASTAPITLDQKPIITSQFSRNLNPWLLEVGGAVNGKGAPTSVWFDYWTRAITNQTSPQNIGQASVPISFRSFLPGFEPGTIVNFRVVASNAFGVVTASPANQIKSGIAGNALRLSGTTQSVRTSTALDALFPDESITIELWFYATKAGVIVSEFDPAQPSTDRSIAEILPSGGIEAGLPGLQPFSVGRVPFGEWHHFALRYDKRSLRLDSFLDGVKTASGYGDRASLPESAARTFLSFGKSAVVKLGTGENFGGELDEIRVWNIARADEDIRTQYLHGISGDDPRLVFYWRMDELGGQAVNDSSLHGISGVTAGIFTSSRAPLKESAPIEFSGESNLSIRTFSLPDLPSRLERSTNLVSWIPVVTNQSSSSGFLQFLLPSQTQKNQFFRIVPQL